MSSPQPSETSCEDINYQNHPSGNVSDNVRIATSRFGNLNHQLMSTLNAAPSSNAVYNADASSNADSAPDTPVFSATTDSKNVNSLDSINRTHSPSTISLNELLPFQAQKFLSDNVHIQTVEELGKCNISEVARKLKVWHVRNPYLPIRAFSVGNSAFSLLGADREIEEVIASPQQHYVDIVHGWLRAANRECSTRGLTPVWKGGGETASQENTPASQENTTSDAQNCNGDNEADDNKVPKRCRAIALPQDQGQNSLEVEDSFNVDVIGEEASIEDYIKITLPRHVLAAFCNEPFFGEAILSCYVLLPLTNDLAQIVGVEESEDDYLIDDHFGRTNRKLLVRFGNTRSTWKVDFIPDNAATARDVSVYIAHMKHIGRPVLTKKEADSKWNNLVAIGMIQSETCTITRPTDHRQLEDEARIASGKDSTADTDQPIVITSEAARDNGRQVETSKSGAVKCEDIAELTSRASDLSNIVPEHGQWFLSTCWIFTVEQFLYLADEHTEGAPRYLEQLAAKYCEWLAARQGTSCGHESNAGDMKTPTLAECRASIQEWMSRCREFQMPNEPISSTSVALKKKRTSPSLAPSLPLNGPIALFFPGWMRSFFITHQMHTLSDFMQQKKSEHSDFVEAIQVYRRKHSFIAIINKAIVRYLVALVTRIQEALSLDTPLDKDAQTWCSGSLVSVNDQAKQFLRGHLGIVSDEIFLSKLTGELSAKYEKWRIEKGMAELKGKGTHATISGWKTAVREFTMIDVGTAAAAVAAGVPERILTLAHKNFIAESAKSSLDFRPALAEPKPLAQNCDIEHKVLNSSVRFVSVAKEDPNFGVLPLASATSDSRERSNTAVSGNDFESCTENESSSCASTVRSTERNAEVSQPAESVMVHGIDSEPHAPQGERKSVLEGEHNSQPPSLAVEEDIPLSSVLQGDILEFLRSQKNINSLRDLIAANKSENSSLILDLMRWRVERNLPEIPSSSAVQMVSDWVNSGKQKSKIVQSASKRKPVESDPALSPKNPAKKRKSGRLGAEERIRAALSENAERGEANANLLGIILSPQTMNFLTSVGITTVEEFLGRRSVELSENFIKWRAEHGIPELKGSGAIASVSGWKGQVRNALGLEREAPTGKRQFVAKGDEGKTKKRRGRPANNPVVNEDDQSSSVQLPLDNLDVSSQSDRNVMKIEVMRHYTDPSDGMPCCEFTVCNELNGFRYDFKIDVRASSVHNKAYGSFLTFLGAKLNDKAPGERKTAPHRIDYQEQFFIEPRSSGDTKLSVGSSGEQSSERMMLKVDRRAFDHVPFSSTSSGCGCIEIGGWQAGCILDSAARMKKILSYIETFISRPSDGEPTTRKNGASIAAGPESVLWYIHEARNTENGYRSIGKCNVTIVREDKYETTSDGVTRNHACFKYVLHLVDKMEKGQVVELLIDKLDSQMILYEQDAEKNGRSRLGSVRVSHIENNEAMRLMQNFRDRETVEMAIESLDLIEEAEAIAGSLRARLDKHLEQETCYLGPLKSRCPLVLTGDTFDSGSDGILPLHDLLVTRRRIHWIAEALTKRREALRCQAPVARSILSSPLTNCFTSKEIQSTSQYSFEECLEVMNWDYYGLMRNENSADLAALKAEVCDEILYNTSRNLSLGNPFNETAWCPLAIEVLVECLKLASSVFLAPKNWKDWAQYQQRVCDLFLDVATKASNRLLALRSSLESLTAAEGQLEALIKLLSFKSDSTQNVRHYHPLTKLLSRDSEFKMQHFLTDSVIRPKVIASFAADAAALLDVTELCNGDVQIAADSIATQSSNNERIVISVAPPVSDECGRIVAFGLARSEATFKRGVAKVDIKWYLVNQVLSVVNAIASETLRWKCVSRHGPVDEQIFSIEHLLHKMRIENAAREIAMLNGSTAVLDEKELITLSARTRSIMSVKYAPESRPLFMFYVWPLLRESYGWKLEEGNSGSHLFVRPGSNTVKQVPERESMPNSYEQSSFSKKLDFPRLPLVLKKIFINHSQAMENERMSSESKASVKEALDSFLQDKVKHWGDKYQDATKSFVDGVRTMFDDLLYPALLNEKEEAWHLLLQESDSFKEKGCSEIYGCEYLIRLFLLLPSILKDMGMEGTLIANIIREFSELFRYFHANFGEFFAERFHPPEEEDHLLKGEIFSPVVDHGSMVTATQRDDNAQQAEMNVCGEGAGGNQNGEANNVSDEKRPANENQHLVPEDKELLTDFTYMLMEQVHFYRATVEDVSKGKRNRMQVGYPGLACRHCIQYGCEGGNTFFSGKIESIATIPSVIYAHIIKCERVPEEVKASLLELKGRHNEQRNQLRYGSQAVFYNRLWTRLHGSPPKHKSASDLDEKKSRWKKSGSLSLDTLQTVEDGDDYCNKESDCRFNCHKQVLQFICKNQELRKDEELKRRLSLYYQCIETEGRLWNPGLASS